MRTAAKAKQIITWPVSSKNEAGGYGLGYVDIGTGELKVHAP